MVWQRRHDEDEVDRVNRLWTVLILGIAGVSAFVYIAVFPDEAISCALTTSGVVGPVLHANRYCLAQKKIQTSPSSTYMYSWYDSVSDHPFVPTFLFLHLLGFLFPHVLAQFLSGFFSNDADLLIMCAEKAKSKNDNEGSFVFNKIRYPLNPSKSLTVVYLLKKSLILLNSLIQVIFVGTMVSPDMVQTTSRAFPLISYCRIDDVEYSCAVHINAIYHKFYTSMFYWFAALTLMNLGSLIGWALKLFAPRLTANTINAYTLTARGDNPEKTQRFLKEFIGRDYLLSLLMSKSKEREITAGDLTLKLWQMYEPSMSPNVESTGANGNEVHLSQL